MVVFRQQLATVAVTIRRLLMVVLEHLCAGLRVTDSLTEPNTLAVSLTAQQEVTSGVLLALLQGRPAVTVAWWVGAVMVSFEGLHDGIEDSIGSMAALSVY